MHTLLELKKGKARLLLFGALIAGNRVIAQGYQTNTYLRKNRVFKGPDNIKVKLLCGLEPSGVRFVPKSLAEPLVLEII